MAFTDRIKQLMSAHLDAELMEGLKQDRYMRAHGKKASGSGTWMFTTKKDGEVNYDNDKEVFQSGPSMKLADAAKKAMDALKSKTIYVMEAKLDPVGKEDDDVDNDGDVDKSDKYLKKRRAAIKKAINTKPAMKEAAKKQKAKLLPVKGTVDDANDVAQKATGESADPATVRMYKDNPHMMSQKGPGGLQSLAKKAQKKVKQAIGKDAMKKEETENLKEYSESEMGKEMVKLNASCGSKHEMYQKMKEKYGCSKETFEGLYASYCTNESVNEAATPQMMKCAKELETYATKHGGIDKADFMKASKMLASGKAGTNLVKFVDGLDTDPREKIITCMGKHMGNKTVGKMFGVNIREEVEELDESTQMMENLADAIDNTDLVKLTVEELSEIEEGIIKALGVAAKNTVGGVAKGVGAVAKGVGKAAHSAVINKQGNVRGTQAAKNDAAANKANKTADKMQRNKDAADRLKAAQDRIKSLSSKPKKPLAASYNEDLNEIGSNFETKPNEKKLADLGRKMMDMGVKEKNDTLSNAYARLGDALTRYGTTFGARNIKDLEKKTGMKQAIIMDLMKRAAKHK